MSIEQRKDRRRPENHGVNLIGARTAYGSARIIDLSPSGARLKLANARRVPDKFTMVLSYTPRITRECQVVWKDRGAIGVKFLRPERTVTMQSFPDPEFDNDDED
jgi:hypothetical protein